MRLSWFLFISFLVFTFVASGVSMAAKTDEILVSAPLGGASQHAKNPAATLEAEIKAFAEFSDTDEDMLADFLGLAIDSLEASFTAATHEVLMSEGNVDIDSIMQRALCQSREINKLTFGLKNDKNALLLTEIGYHPDFSVKIDNDHNYQYTLSQNITDLVNVSASRSQNTKESDSGSTAYSLSLDLRRLDDSDLKAARFGYNLDLLSFASSRELFKLRVLSKYYDLVLALEECKVLKNSCERWIEMLDYAKSKYELGLANKIDYLNAEVNYGNAQNSLLQQEQSIETLKEQFLDLAGYDIDSDGVKLMGIKYNIRFEPIPTVEVEAILANKDGSIFRKDVEAEKVRLKIAEIKYKKAKKQARPKLNLNLIKTQYDGKSVDDEFNSNLTYKFNFGLQETGVNEWIEKNNLELRKLALDEIDKGALIEKRDSIRRLKYLERAYIIASKSLAQAYENYEFSKLSFQKGLISNIDLRDAQDKLTSAKRSVVNIIIQHKLACQKFYFSMGKDL